MIWTRKQYIAHCQYEFTGREMFCQLFGPLAPLIDEWKKQGATPAEIGLTAFDWDYVLKTWLSGNCGPITGLTPTVLEDTPEYTITRDGLGRTMKLIKSSATLPTPPGSSGKDHGRLAEDQALVRLPGRSGEQRAAAGGKEAL